MYAHCTENSTAFLEVLAISRDLQLAKLNDNSSKQMKLLAPRKRDTLKENYFATPHNVAVLFPFLRGKAEEVLSFSSCSFAPGDYLDDDAQTNFSRKRGRL